MKVGKTVNYSDKDTNVNGSIFDLNIRLCNSKKIEFSWYERKWITKNDGKTDLRYYHRYLLLPLEVLEKFMEVKK